MLTSAVLRIIRDRVGTLDDAVALVLQDQNLLTRVDDAVRYFQVQQVGEFLNHTVDVDAFDVEDAVSPVFSDPLGLIVAYWVSLQILQEAYRGRLQRGEFGTLWRSGLEEESTASAAKYYDGRIAAMRTELHELLLVYHREAQGARIY